MPHEESAQSGWKTDTVFKQDTKYLKCGIVSAPLPNLPYSGLAVRSSSFAYGVKAAFPSTA